VRIKAVILTLDQVAMLETQLSILRADPLISEIVVVNNGSRDGTHRFLEARRDVVAIHRENRAPGPGRNAGLDAAGSFDYALLLDGGIRPLRGGVARMLEYLEATPAADVIGVEINAFATDLASAQVDWPAPIARGEPFRNRGLSHTAYCLACARAFAGIRFSEEGPFGETGWGVDDNEMAYRWNEAGIALHVTTQVHPFRAAGGSFRRLFEETGIWPNQYGSIYEQRLVHCQQRWPQYHPGVQWGEPWLTVVVPVDRDGSQPIQVIKRAHDRLRLRRFRTADHFNPYSVVAWCPGRAPHAAGFLDWAEPRRLRQHHGDTTVVNGRIVRRNARNEAHWTGDFHLFRGEDPRQALRPGAAYHGVASTAAELDALLARYAEVWPAGDEAPRARGERIGPG
jgi:glycosyltransferase involved in cell wall biosynthesis